MKKILFITTLFITNCLIAQEWISIGKDSNGDEYYYKPNTNYTAWIKQISTKISYYSNGKKQIDGYTIQLMKFDCDDKKIGLIQSTTYSKQGKPVNSFDIDDILVKMNYVVPDSLGEDFLNTFCTHK